MRPSAERFFYTVTLSPDGFDVRLNLYNTAWLSRKKEKQGELFYPVTAISAKVLDRPAVPLAITLLHHPFNWIAADNAREFRKLIEATSDLILTGHEHDPAIYAKIASTRDSTQYSEGAVLQSEDASSGFNAFYLDTSSQQCRFVEFSWKSGCYQVLRDTPAVPFRGNGQLRRSEFENTSAYDDFLHEIGTGFTHPKVKGELHRDDVFVYPDLVRQFHHAEGKPASPPATEPGQDLIASILESGCILIAGADLSGKTTLAKALYCDLKANHALIPLLISGESLAQVDACDVRRMIRSAISEQYGSERIAAFEQLEPNRKALIVDDFDHSKLNLKGQRLFIDNARASFGVIVVLCDEFFALDEISHDNEADRPFAGFDNLRIREFGHRLRGRLIEKWVILGREHQISRAELVQEVDAHEQLVQTVLGRHLLPSYPLTILTILQAWEANRTHDTTNGSYGYLYETLILQALSVADFRPAEIDVILTFLSRSAFQMFDSERNGLTEPEIRDAAQLYYDYYRARLPGRYLEKLLDARILSLRGDQYEFRYPYCFYFFVARYLRDHVHLPEYSVALRAKIQDMADHVHYEQYANVLTFYVYQSKDTSAIRTVLANARLIYDDVPPCDFRRDVAFVNELYVKTSKPIPVSLPPGSPESRRDEYRRDLDRADEEADAGELIEQRRGEKVRYSKELSDIVKVNIATKTLQILGQIIRNSPGSIPGDLKRDVASEAYLLGMRTLNAVLRVPARHLDNLKRYIVELIKEHKVIRKPEELSDADWTRLADQGVIALTQAYAHGMIQRISQAVGLRELEDIYSEVMALHKEGIPTRLIDVAIKLDHFLAVPEKEISELDGELKDNFYARNALRDLVFTYLYLKDSDYRTRSRLMSRFKIQGKRATLIDNAAKTGPRRS